MIHTENNAERGISLFFDPQFSSDLPRLWYRDHFRALSIFKEQSIVPGNKGRNYVCRRLIRRFIRLNRDGVECPFSDWIQSESVHMERSIRDARRFWRKNGEKAGTMPDSFYWDTFGIMPEEMVLLRR